MPVDPSSAQAAPGIRGERMINRQRGSVMRDVARLAGVSHQTVSRVVNEHPSVREETRQRVLEAMQALSYRRNLAARTLATRRSGTLGIIAYETTLFGPASMLYAIEDAARTAGYFVSISTVRNLDRRSVLDAADWLCQQSVEGIIAIAPKTAVISALAQLPATMARIGVGGGQDEAVSTIQIDNRAGARLATQHLLELGHKTVHHVAGPADWPEAQERIEGWRDTLHAAKAPVPPVQPSSWSPSSGFEQGQILAKDPSVTAIFCANDHLALGVLRALHEAHRRVPDEVSVMGFDDMPESGFFLPPLSTIRQDFAELGRRSLATLLDQIGQEPGSRPADHLMLPPQLVLRSSTARPPAAAKRRR